MLLFLSRTIRMTKDHRELYFWESCQCVHCPRYSGLCLNYSMLPAAFLVFITSRKPNKTPPKQNTIVIQCIALHSWFLLLSMILQDMEGLPCLYKWEKLKE